MKQASTTFFNGGMKFICIWTLNQWCEFGKVTVYLHQWQMRSIQENCLKAVFILAVPFGDSSGAEMTLFW